MRIPLLNGSPAGDVCGPCRLSRSYGSRSMCRARWRSGRQRRRGRQTYSHPLGKLAPGPEISQAHQHGVGYGLSAGHEHRTVAGPNVFLKNGAGRQVADLDVEQLRTGIKRGPTFNPFPQALGLADLSRFCYFWEPFCWAGTFRRHLWMTDFWAIAHR